MEKVIRTERGWPGHFIGAARCLFRRNTLLQYGNLRLIVSSVGAYRNSSGEYEPIGESYYYECSVFFAKIKDGFWEAHPRGAIYPDSPNTVCHPYGDQEANDQHEIIVDEISNKMLNGYFKGA